MSTYNSAFLMSDLRKACRRGWMIGGFVGTTFSCVFYGGIGFFLFGTAGLHGGLALAISMAAVSLLYFERKFNQKGGIVEALESWGM